MAWSGRSTQFALTSGDLSEMPEGLGSPGTAYLQSIYKWPAE